ncbi:uncharacterized protein [Procambarus clarkii]|uniref:uncharacterized protein n=1 Tax=Procambarus clarkii TaxID=6728 RepID=UPI003743C049
MSGGMSSCLPMSGGMSSCLPKSGDMSSCLLLYHTSCSSYRKLQNNRFSPQTEPVENLESNVMLYSPVCTTLSLTVYDSFPSGAGEDGESRTRSRSRRCVAASEGHRPLDSRASPSPTRDASSLDYWRRVRSLSRETRLRQEARERHLQKVELEERRRRQQILSERKIERDALMTRFLREPLRQHRAARAAKSTSGRDEGDAAGGGGGGGRATREEREARRNVLASRSVPDLEEALRVVRGEDEALDVRARAFLSPRQMRHRAPKEDQGICDRYLRTQSRATVQRRTPGPTPRWGVAPPGYTEIRENQKPYPALSHEMPPPERQVAAPRSRHLRGRSSVDSGCKRSNTLSDTLSVTSSEERDAEYLLSEYCPPSDSHIMVLPRPRLDRRSSMPDLRDYRCVSSAVMYETIATLGSLGDTRGLLVLPPWGHDDHTTLTASAPPHIHHTKNNGENLHRSPKKWAQKMNKFIENETNAVLQTSPLLSALPPSLGRPSSQKGRRSQRKEWVSKHTSMKTLQKKILPTSLTDSSSQTDGMQYMRPTSAVHHRCNSLGSEGAESVYYDSLEEDESRNNTKRSVNQAFYVPIKNETSPVRAECLALPARLTARLEERRTAARPRPFPGTTSRLALAGNRMNDEEKLYQFGAKDDSLSNEEMTSASQEYYLNTNACTSDSDIRDSPKVVTRKKKMVPLSPSKSNTGKSQSDILQLSSTKSVNFRGSSTASPRSSVQITTAQPAPCLNSVRHNSPSTRVPEVVVEANSRQHFNTYTPFPIGSTPSSGSPRRPDQSSQQPYRCVVVDGFGHQHEKTSEGLIKIPKSALALHESVKDGVNGCDNKSVKFAFEGASIVKSDLPLYRNNAIAQYTQEHVYTETDNERLCGLNHKSSPDSEYHIHISQSGLETFDKIFTDHARVVNTAEGDTLSNTRVNDEEGVLASSGLENNDTLNATYVVKNISQKTATESNDISHYEFLPNTEEEDLKKKSSCIPQKEHEIIASTTSGKDVLLESGFIDMDDFSLSSDSLSINCNNIEQTPLPETTNTMSENFENIIKIHISPSSRCELSSDTGDSSSETLVKSSRKMYTQGSSVKEFQSVEKHTFEDVSVSHEYTITVDKGKANSEQAWDDTCEENGDWKSAENKPRNIDSEDGDHHDAREDSHGTKEGTLTATDVARDHCLPENDVRTALTGHTYVREHIDIREQSDERENLDIREKRIEKEDLDERALKNRTKDSLHAEGATDSNVSSSFENSICSKGSPRALEEENFFTSSNQGQMLSQNTESSSKYVSTQSTDPSEEQVLVPSAELGEEQDLASCTELSEEQNLVPWTEPSKEQDWVRDTEPSEVQDLVSRTEPSEEQHLVHSTEPSKEQDLVSCTDPNKEHDRAPGEEQTIIPNTRSSEDQVLILCPDSNTAQLSIPGTEGPENEAEELSDGTDSWDRVTVVRALSADSSGSRNLTPDMNPEVPMSDTLHQEAGEEISIDDFLCMDQQNRFRSPPEASTRSPLLENNSDLLEEIFRAITPSKSEHALVDETSSELSTIEEDDELSDASPLLQQETSLLKESVNTSKEENGNIATLIGMENCDVRSTNCSISSQGSASNAQDKNNIVVEGSENAEVGESEASHVVRESERVVVGGTRGGGANGTLVVDGVDNLLKVKGDGGNVMVECIDDSVAVEGVDDSVAVEDVDDSVAVEDVDDSVAVEDADDSVAVEDVDNSVAVEGVDNSVAVEDVDDSVAVEGVDDSVAVEDVDNSVAVEDVDDSVAVEDVDNSVAVEDVDDSVAVEDVDDSVAVEDVDDSVDDSVAVEDVDDSVAVEDVDDSVAVGDVDDSFAVEDVDNSVAVEDVDNSVAVEDVDDSVAEEGVDDSVAVEDVDDSVAVEDDVDDSVAVEGVDDSVAVEGVGGSSAIRRIENHKEVGQERKRAVGESGNMVFGATEEDQEGSRGEADGATRQVFRADRRRVRRSQPQQIGEFSLATTPATSPTHDPDIATTQATSPTHDPDIATTQATSPTHDPDIATTQATSPTHDPDIATTQATSPTHDPDIATTPATSPTHDPDIATTPATSPTHDPDIATTPATSPTHDPDIATTPATSPTHDPDIATTPATSPTHDPDIATTPATSPTHDPDIATTPATSPTHDPDIATTPAASPTHDPDIATTLGTSPTHDPDMTTTPATSPTHDPDIATTLGTSPTHDPDIATTPEKSLMHDPDIATTLGTSPTHDPDMTTTPATSPTHDPDIATTLGTSPTHDPDMTTTPATSPTHDPDIATTLGTSPTHDPDMTTTPATSPTHDPDIATTLGTSPTHDPDIATTPEKSLMHDPDIATTLGTSPIHDPDKDVDEKERSAVQGVCRDLEENIQHKDIRPKEVSEEESQRQAHDGEETDNSLLSSVTLDLTESVTKGEYDELLNHVEEYIEQKVLIGKRIVPNTYNSHLMRETTLEDGYSIYGESSLRGNYVKGKETPIKSDATAPQGYDNIGDTENEGAEAFASLRSNILMNSDDDIVSCINLEDKSDIRNQVNTGSICREDVHESSCADEVLRHNDGPVAPTMSLAKSSSGACGFSGREDPPQSSLMAGSSTSSDDSPRNRDGNEREAAAAANSPSSDSGVVEMAGKNIQSPSEESAESVAAEVHGSRDTHSQASARSEQSANSIPCPRPSSKQAKDRANRITSGHHSSSGCGRALRETSEATVVNGCASFQDLCDGSDIEDSKPQRRHWESPQRNYFQELSPQIDSDPVSMSRHKLVQEYVDSLQLHQNSGDGSPQGTAGSPPRSTEDTPTDHQSDYEASDSGDASYSERLLKALESRRSRRNRPRSSNIDIEDNPGRYRPSTLSALDMFLATLSKYRGHQLEGGEAGRDSTPPALLPAADDNVTVQVRAGPRQHDVRISSRRQVRLVVNVGNPVASSDSGCVPDTSQSECRGGRAGPPAGGSPGGRRRSRRPGRDGAPAPSRAAAAVNREVDQLLTDVREYLNTKLKR